MGVRKMYGNFCQWLKPMEEQAKFDIYNGWRQVLALPIAIAEVVFESGCPLIQAKYTFNPFCMIPIWNVLYPKGNF